MGCGMRQVMAVVAALALTQCAAPGGGRFEVGRSPRAYVVIGVAESARATEPAYTLLWRRFDPIASRFMPYDDSRSLAAHTNEGGAVRLRGIPGEFTMVEIEPGAYALDSAFAVVRDGPVTYFANGVVHGPRRPAFAVGAGEAIFLGVWRAELNDGDASASLWRLEEADMRALAAAARSRIEGPLRLRETYDVDVPCAPSRINGMTQRQIC